MTEFATVRICALLLACLAVAAAAPGSWKTKHAFTDLDAEAQFSQPRMIHRCACFTIADPKINKTEWFCTEDSDPRCRLLQIGGLQIVQEKVMALQEFKEPVQLQAGHECVCHLQVSEESTDFSCSNPSCYKLFVEKEEIASANSSPNFECDINEIHQEDPDCCRCREHRGVRQWDCISMKQRCMRVHQRCPINLLAEIAGSCCPVCLEGATQSATPFISNHETEPAALPFAEDAVQPCCSICKENNDESEEIEIRVSRSNSECQCDLFVEYPYDELPTCISKLSANEVEDLADKLAKELVDVANWKG